ncbi:MAG: short-chain dehydrogenase [Flavobacteriales bacterium]|nr:MAG: short-chain dehydrogenase [Flavobacteriales bacterium]
MNYYFITGSSKGLGKSLTELLLEDENNFVYGIARTSSIKHERYIHTNMDLSNLDEVENYLFPELNNVNRIILVNNAGMVGDVNRVGKIDNKKIIDCYNLNLISPVILINNFISKYTSLSCEKMVLNISSGAGRTPIDGWNVYCSTKAGIDMFSQVLKEEAKIDNSNVTVLSLAPGIIDTDMQVQIREAKESAFSSIEKFIEYKKDGDLTLPDVTAKQVYRFITEKDLSTNVLCSVRDLSE